MSQQDIIEDYIADYLDSINKREMLTDEELSGLARDMERVFYSLNEYSYHPPDPMQAENERLEKLLIKERNKRGCPHCRGTGRLRYNAGPWGVDTQCDHCHGEGKIAA